MTQKDIDAAAAGPLWGGDVGIKQKAVDREDVAAIKNILELYARNVFDSTQYGQASNMASNAGSNMVRDQYTQTTPVRYTIPYSKTNLTWPVAAQDQVKVDTELRKMALEKAVAVSAYRMNIDVLSAAEEFYKFLRGENKS